MTIDDKKTCNRIDVGVDPILDWAQYWLGCPDGDYVPVNPLVTLEKMLAICGPNKAKMAITTIATKTRINAYSTKP